MEPELKIQQILAIGPLPGKCFHNNLLQMYKPIVVGRNGKLTGKALFRPYFCRYVTLALQLLLHACKTCAPHSPTHGRNNTIHLRWISIAIRKGSGHGSRSSCRARCWNSKCVLVVFIARARYRLDMMVKVYKSILGGQKINQQAALPHIHSLQLQNHLAFLIFPLFFANQL